MVLSKIDKVITRKKIATKTPRSICWHQNSLIDFVSGGNIYHMDGSIQTTELYFGYKFDAAKISNDGTAAVIYEKLGTKGVLLQHGKQLREINRSYYCANVYEYPIQIIDLPNNRKALVHCPNKYCQLEIEDFETGELLGNSNQRDPIDTFHSRLESNQKYILSAGWHWHPYDVLTVYKIDEVLKEPQKFDRSGIGLDFAAEISSARFYGEDKIVLTSSNEEPLQGEDDLLQPSSIGIYDIPNGAMIKQAKLQFDFGNVFPINADFALDLYDIPKVINLNNGKVEEKFEGIKSGKQRSSIIGSIEHLPNIAFHPNQTKVAITTDNGIEILELTIE